MALNKDLVGKKYPATCTEATLDAMQNYARAYNDDNSAFFNGSRGGGIIAPPMYAVVATWPSIMSVVGDPDLKVDLMRLLHGEQDMAFLLPIRPGDKITALAKVASIETKASGETLVIEIDAVNQAGEKVNRTLFNAFIRGGGKGGSDPRVAEPVRGEPIVYGLSIPAHAPHPGPANAFVRFLLSADGRAILRREHLDALDAPITVGQRL